MTFKEDYGRYFVKYTHPESGRENDQELCAFMKLEIGKEYEISEIEMHGYCTRFTIVGFPKVQFNSVNFSYSRSYRGMIENIVKQIFN